jgi:hypothetical protein
LGQNFTDDLDIEDSGDDLQVASAAGADKFDFKNAAQQFRI